MGCYYLEVTGTVVMSGKSISRTQMTGKERIDIGKVEPSFYLSSAKNGANNSVGGLTRETKVKREDDR